MRRLIISGGRNYRPVAGDEKIITKTVERFGVEEILTGGATGADAMGENYAKAMGINLRVFPAKWGTHGKKAGPIRNAEMAAQCSIHDVCLLFPGGRGTRDMQRTAEAFGLHIIFAYPKEPGCAS